MYGGPVYPGTLTYRGTVPNIELLRKVSVLRSVKVAGDTGDEEFQFLEYVLTILFHEAGSHKFGKCL
jgi:hypothetical protein